MLAAYFLFYKQPISAKLTTQPQTLKSFAPGENPVKIKSFNEGKILILTLKYKTTTDISKSDTRILLKFSGNKLKFVASGGSKSNSPKFDVIETSRFADTMVFGISDLNAKKGEEREAVFYGFTNEPTSFRVHAEIKSGNKTLGKSNSVNVSVK